MKRMVAMAMVMTVLLAAGAATAAMKGSADVVKASAATSVVTGTAGERVEFAIELDISKTWHIYAHGDSNFIGVDLTPSESFPLQKMEAEYPSGHKKEFFGEMVYMIDGTSQIKASALIPADLAKGEHKLEFGVTVQACDDKTCLAPIDLPVTVKLKVQ